MTTRRAALLALTALALSLPIRSAARILTSSDGRTIDAEIVGFEGLDKVKIKRADTGQTFTLPISSFAEADREALLAEAKAEAAKPPPPLSAKDLRVELSRKTQTGKTEKVPVITVYTDGTRRQTGTINVTAVESAYSVTLVNHSGRTLQNLRVDYVLFAERENRGPIRAPASVTHKADRMSIDPIPPHSRQSAATVPIATRKVNPAGGASWAEATTDLLPIELKGVWVRVYQGEELVLEQAVPESLMTENRWPRIPSSSGSETTRAIIPSVTRNQ